MGPIAYVLIEEWGEYSDYAMYVRGVFTTEAAAMAVRDELAAKEGGYWYDRSLFSILTLPVNVLAARGW